MSPLEFLKLSHVECVAWVTKVNAHPLGGLRGLFDQGKTEGLWNAMTAHMRESFRLHREACEFNYREACKTLLVAELGS